MPRPLSSLVLSAILASSPLAGSEVRVWGDHAAVHSYDPSESIFNIPAELATLDVVDLVAAGIFACAVTSDKRIIVWGGTSSSYLASVLAVPSIVQGHVMKVAVNQDAILVLTDTGTVVGWGDIFSTIQTTIPAGLVGVTDIAVGNNSAFAMHSDGSVTTWGSNQVPAPTGTMVVAVTGDRGLSIYARKSDNSVQSWGTSPLPIELPPAGIFASTIVNGANFTQFSALKIDHTIALWGESYAHIIENVPVGLHDVTQVSLGDIHGLVRRSDGSLVTWGDGVTSSSGLEIPSGLAHARAIGTGFGFSTALISAPPTAIQWQTQPSVVGAAVQGTLIGTLITHDPDSVDTFTYSLVAGDGATDNNLFSLTGAQVMAAATLPGAAATRNIRVRSTDSGGQSFEQTLAIPVQAAPQTASDNSNSSSLGCGVGGGISVLLAGLFTALTIIRNRK